MPADAVTKTAWRAELSRLRRELAPAAREAAADAIEAHLLPRLTRHARVAAYLPVGAEPGSGRLLDRAVSAGVEILLPVIAPGGERALDWALHRGPADLVPGPLGLREPAGPRLGSNALVTAGLVVVPALAVDRRGTRLGRGAGYYDRALAAVPPEVPVVALLHDGELVDRLPADPWDRPVTAVVTPATGWTELR